MKNFIYFKSLGKIPHGYFFSDSSSRSTNLVQSSQDIRITGIQNGENTDSKKLTTSSTKLVVTTLEVVNSGLGQHGVVLKLRLSQGRSVAGNDNQLGLSLSERLESALVSEGVLTTLDDEGKSGVDRFLVLLDFRGLETC